MQGVLDRMEREVAALAALAPSDLPVESLQELIARVSALSDRLAGIGSRALGELQVRGGGQVPDGPGTTCPTPAWLRSVSSRSAHASGRDVRTAVALRALPMVASAVVAGEIGPEHARVLTRLVGAIDPQSLTDSQPALLEVARRTDPEQLASYVRHLIATWCPPQIEAEEAAAEDRRFLQLRNKQNGSWRGTFELPDAAMEIVLSVLEPLARRDGDGDTRSAGMRRADAMTDVFGLALRYGDLPDAGGSRPRLTYVQPALPGPRLAATGRIVPLDLDRHPGADCATGAWTGPATQAQIDTLLCDARVERLTLDELGRVVDLSAFTDTITAAQRRAVAARDRCCAAKGCTRPPAFCDVHHLRALADGGATEVGNLVLLCRRHHVMWHRRLLHLTDLRTPWLRLPQPRVPARE